MNLNSFDKKKVVLGLSGGVDSTAAALLLQEKGFKVIGLYFNVHNKNNESSITGVEKAKKMASELDIKLHILDVNEKFESFVIDNFINEYSSGKTPNPCVICNPNIKFKTLIEVANKERAYYIATGHYARTLYSSKQECFTIGIGDNTKKDQSYMLYRLPEEYIKRLIFPLGEIADKSNTRDFVRENHLSNADDKDSQEICFIPDEIDYITYLQNRGVDFKEGNFIDKEGNILGSHKGIGNYTIGQRKGLGIALGKPAFVVSIDKKSNSVVLGDNKDLFTREIKIKNCYFQSTNSGKFPKNLLDQKLLCKIRYKSEFAECKISDIGENSVTIHFEREQRAAAPGQSAVIYLENEIVGGGFIQ